MWFNLKPISIGEDKKELPVLLKTIVTLELLNPKISTTPNNKLFLFWSKSLPICLTNYRERFH